MGASWIPNLQTKSLHDTFKRIARMWKDAVSVPPVQVPHQAKMWTRGGSLKQPSWVRICLAVCTTLQASPLKVNWSLALPVTHQGPGDVQRDARVTPTKTRSVCITVIWTLSGSTHQSKSHSPKASVLLLDLYIAFPRPYVQTHSVHYYTFVVTFFVPALWSSRCINKW